ncbi:MAG: hypothetical protein J7M34_05210 [Anaerolineae bacterium]|nr:hypothetical protein [Anaerolineae bacterium]
MMAERVGEKAEFDLKNWLSEGIRGVRQEMKVRPRLMPEEFCEHVRASQREALLAVRSLLDEVIERLEPAEARTPSRRSRRRQPAEVEAQ